MTKSDLVASDQYIEIYDKSLAHFQISITSTSYKKSLEYEKAPIPSKRIEAIEKLQKYGFDVSLRLSPFIEENIDINIINKIRCNKILIEFLKVNHWIEKCFNLDYSEYTVNFGSYKNLELNKKIELVNKIIGFKELSVGEYVYDHYLYFRDNVNFNKEDCCNLNLKYHQEPQLKLEL